MIVTKTVKGKEVKKFKPSPLAARIANIVQEEWDLNDLDFIIGSIKQHKMNVQQELLRRSYENAK